MGGREFLVTARLLLNDDAEEASLRTSISRSYYAAYLEVRAFCESEAGAVIARSAREHGVVADMARSLLPETAVRLRFLRRFRNEADYDMNAEKETIRTSALTAFDEALRVIAEVDAEAERLKPADTHTDSGEKV